ncbi:MAG: methylated-DNA--[protein]-cysteine S-methyltransferase [Rhodobacteraceae bacterium]|nr:methylated-DNA--[protein]-cysteine S-methyltransferase [Paracoccaceae bacterium]
MTQQPQSVGIESPLGPLQLWAEDGQITGLDWQEGPELTDQTPKVLHDAALQLSAYFRGELTAFDLPMRLGPGDFQAIFQNALLNIPYGETRTYGDLAKEIGVSAQAAGQACGANRIPTLVPCHRVLGASSLGGFSGAGGVETKVELLKLEGAGGLLI